MPYHPPSPYMSHPAAPSLSPEPAWVWTLDEAAIRDDGGAAGLAAAVDAQQAQQYAYVPPTVAYERALWEATRAAESSSSAAPVHVAASAGWILPRAADTPPVFIAHTMLAAVWLLRQSLPDGAVTPSAWAQLAQAASATALSPSPKAGPTKRTRASSTAAAASASHDDDDVSSSVEQGAPLPHQHRRSRSNTPPTVTTVTNHNRRIERQREAKRLKTAQTRRNTLGLTEPGPSAPAAEHAAHRSISPADEPTVAWIIKQPAGPHDFFSTSRLPYATANTMLQRARAIGNRTAKVHAAYFVQNWRRSGSPLLLQSDSPMLQPPASTPALVHHTFRRTWDAITFTEAVTATAGVVYRWAMALLGRMYQHKIDQLKAAASATSHDARDRKVRTQAKKEIWDAEAPPCTWAAYNARLKRARRWYEAAETLGWGVLVLIPSDTITPYWVEQTLRAGEWNIWLQLVQRVNPAAVAASHDFDAWLGPPGIEHGSLEGASTLTIEAGLPYRITEVPDSEGESDAATLDGSSEDEHDGDGEDGHSEHSTTRDSPLASALDLRQLFQPHDTQA